MLAMNDILLCALIADGHNYGKAKNGKLFNIVSQKRKFVVYTNTIEEAVQWTQCINECIAERARAHSLPSQRSSVQSVNDFDVSSKDVEIEEKASSQSWPSHKQKQKLLASASLFDASSFITSKNKPFAIGQLDKMCFVFDENSETEEAVDNNSRIKPKINADKVIQRPQKINVNENAQKKK